MDAILGAVTMVITPIKNLIGQIGPAYDPLFYDVMVYIFGTMLFAVFLLSVIAYWLRRKGLGGGSAKEKWTQELERYFEREQIGLIPDEKHHW
jgi:Cu/Ag efflux pump CusA